MTLRLAIAVLLGGGLGTVQSTSSRVAAAAVTIPHIERALSEQAIAPEYVLYSDPFTASVLDHWKRPPSLLLAPKNSAVVCPWSSAKGLHGYAVTVQVDSLNKEQAVVRYMVKCARSFRGGAFATGEILQVDREGRRWSISKVLDRWIT